jgi:hypothetical protein
MRFFKAGNDAVLIDLNILSVFEFRPIGGHLCRSENIFDLFKNKKVQELFPAPFL